MLRAFLNTFFFIVSGVLYFNAPDFYSYGFCSLISILFLLQNILYFVFKRDRSIVGFAFFFAIAFGLTNFIYPVFYYLSDPEFSLFSLPFNENVISRSTSIAYVGYAVYMLAMDFSEMIFENRKYESKIKNLDIKKVIKIIYVFLLVFLAAYFVTGGHQALASEYSGEGEIIEKGVTAYIYVLVVATAIILSIFMFANEIPIKQRILYFISIVFLMIFFLTLGSRTFPLMLALSSIVSYNNNIRKISAPVLLLLVIAGAVLLTFIVFARTTSFTSQDYVANALAEADINMIWDFGSDLVINNRNLYSLIDYADNFGHTYGLSMLGGLSSPIPFAQSFICSTFDIQPEFLSSSGFSTYIDLGLGSTWGLGTNLVADAYLPFGMIGVLFFFGLLGFIVAKSKAMINSNIYWSVCYYVLVSNAVFFARGGFFDCFRFMIWGIVIIYIISFFRKVEF